MQSKEIRSDERRNLAAIWSDLSDHHLDAAEAEKYLKCCFCFALKYSLVAIMSPFLEPVVQIEGKKMP